MAPTAIASATGTGEIIPPSRYRRPSISTGGPPAHGIRLEARIAVHTSSCVRIPCRSTAFAESTSVAMQCSAIAPESRRSVPATSEAVMTVSTSLTSITGLPRSTRSGFTNDFDASGPQ